MSETAQRIAEAEQAEAAFKRYVGPALNSLRADYLVKLAELAAQPLNEKVQQGIVNLSLAIRVAGEVEAQMRALMADGTIARQDAHRAAEIARMSPEERKWKNYAPGR